ncbi:MAG TPA: glycoside hydrolase domain-containing protein, partial [Streptosporangiaceae bacterium]|nr:glycoside hydrolase domain-containing protein [Streptosporangiaceae bacterium]
GWTRQLHARGYRSGVYTSAGSGGANLARTRRLWGRRLARPDSLWFALWDGKANLRGAPYLSRHRWPHRGHRIKQYRGDHRVRIAGRRLIIDSDLVSGAVYK